MSAASWRPVALTVTQRHDLIDVWTIMFTDIYVHYSQKKALYGYDPIRALSALRRQIPYLDSAGFLRELTPAINRLRDQHTQLYIDAADQNLRGYVVALPFLVEPYGSHRHPPMWSPRPATTSPVSMVSVAESWSPRGTGSRSPGRWTSMPTRSPVGDPTPAVLAPCRRSRSARCSICHHPMSCGSTSVTAAQTTRRRTRTARSGSNGERSNPAMRSRPTPRSRPAPDEPSTRRPKPPDGLASCCSPPNCGNTTRPATNWPPERADGSPPTIPMPSRPASSPPRTARSATSASGRSMSTTPVASSTRSPTSCTACRGRD